MQANDNCDIAIVMAMFKMVTATKFDRVFPSPHHTLSMALLCIKSDGLA